MNPPTADLKPASRRVLEAAGPLGLRIEIVSHAETTRTAEEAAKACGCAVGQIIKSLIFKGEQTGTPWLILVSGPNRVNEAALATHTGEKLVRPDARFVREVTGFAIGGIPPFGHANPMKTLIDRDLLQYAEVWAAAGTPDTVFKAAPGALVAALKAPIVTVT